MSITNVTKYWVAALLSLRLTVPCIYIPPSSSSAESEVCKLETLLQTEISIVTVADAVRADAAKTPPALRRRKRTCSRRQGEREGGGSVDRRDRGVGDERDRREASESGLDTRCWRALGTNADSISCALPPSGGCVRRCIIVTDSLFFQGGGGKGTRALFF